MANTDPIQSLSSLGLEGLRANEEIEAVWVTITGIYAKRDGKWDRKLFDVPQGRQLINLMDLNVQAELLGEKRLPAGTYTEFRFQLEENDEAGGLLHNYTVVNGKKVPLKIPSNEIKPENFDVVISKGTVVQLVFDVDSENFVDRNKGMITNPRKMLKFAGLLDEEFGSITGQIKLPAWVNEDILSIELNLFRASTTDAIWTTSLTDNLLKFEIAGLVKGSYRLEAEIKLLGLGFSLHAGPFTIEAGIKKSITLSHEL
jgi:hypothetical protein